MQNSCQNYMNTCIYGLTDYGTIHSSVEGDKNDT